MCGPSLGGIGFAAGVLIGGILATGPGWRWVFFINVPVGVFLLTTIPAVVPAHRPDRATRRLDVLGAVIVTTATGMFIYGMINAGDAGWRDLGTLPPIAVAIVLFGVFIFVERTVRTPLLDLGLLARRPIASGAFLMLVVSGVLFAGLFLGSQYLQHLRGLSALETGLFFLPAALAGLALVCIGNGLLIGLSADGNVYADALPASLCSRWGADHCSSPRERV